MTMLPNEARAEGAPTMRRHEAIEERARAPEAQSRLTGVQAAGPLDALFVLNSLRIGGSETKIVRIANALHAQGRRVGIASLDDSTELLSAVAPGVRIWFLHRRGRFSFAALKALRSLLSQQRPQVIFSINLYPALYIALATLTASSRARRIGVLNTTVFQQGEEWRRSFYAPILRRFEGLVYGCELQRDAWSKQLCSAQSRAKVIYNGVDVEHFKPAEDRAQQIAARTSLGVPAAAFVVGTVGRLSAEKNQAVLIEAVAALRTRGIDAHLLLVGDGSLRETLRERAAALQVESNVTFAGALGDVRPALTAMDVFVLPSHVETFSNAALEAMAMSRPVILSGVGGAAEMVRNGVDGFTLQGAELRERLPALLADLANDPAQRARLGRAARERILDRFSLQTMVACYASLLSAETLRSG